MFTTDITFMNAEVAYRTQRMRNDLGRRRVLTTTRRRRDAAIS
ncbi:hypothetical protein [Nocardioides piscis]|nr:hypothetical protein [Nocardioides piscis]